MAGHDSDYYRRFVEDTEHGHTSSAGGGAAILEALSADVQAGYLSRQADLVAAEVFTDFLDMAGHLVAGGYIHPAASLIGAVAEDGLRRLARGANIGVSDRDDMNAINSKLRQAGAYSPLVAKRVTLWADVRNNADHGHFDQVTRADVDEMFKGVVAFLAERVGG